MTSTCRRVLLFLLVLSILVACAPLTPTASRTPPPTATPLPTTPEYEHELTYDPAAQTLNDPQGTPVLLVWASLLL